MRRWAASLSPGKASRWGGVPEGRPPFGNRKIQTRRGRRAGEGPLGGEPGCQDWGGKLWNVPHGAYADEACLYANEAVCMQMRSQGFLSLGYHRANLPTPYHRAPAAWPPGPRPDLELGVTCNRG